MEYGLKQYIFVIRELTAREIKRKYSRSVLGILWSVLNPLLFMGVMTIMFSGFCSNSFEYPVYYMTGYTMWQMFSTATTTSLTAFEDNKNLFQKSKLPRVIFVLSRDYTALVNCVFSSIALGLVLLVLRIKLTWTAFIFPIAVIFELVFAIGISYILATIYIFYKDIIFIWRNATVLLAHIIAIYLPIERYPDSLIEITKKNPLFIYSDVARKAILYNTFDLDQILMMIIWSTAALLIGLVIFKLAENSIVNKV